MGQTDDTSLPRLVERDGRHALIVDGAPFLMLGAQCHNSSAWPATLPNVWAAIESLHANTLEAPVYWEQFEPEPGRFDTTNVDLLLAQARDHHTRLVLLWFGTWKNGSAHYLPLWMKRQPELCPRIIGKDGRRVDSPSPFAPALQTADARAFAGLLRHLKAVDPRHTVIMIQVENEPGAWNSVRDYGPAAQQAFLEAVPAELLQALGRKGASGQNWPTVFGPDADEYFHAWSVARYIERVAAAGKAEYPLPMYVNAALRDPLSHPAAGTYESGGATDNVLDIWKAAAPSIDLLAPDIYLPESERYRKVLDLYGRPDNALFVPETSRQEAVARFCYAAFGHGAIGWSPFGVDDAGGGPAGALPDGAALEPVAMNFRALGPMMRELARFSFEGRVHAAVEEPDGSVQTIALGRWQGRVTFGRPGFGPSRLPRPNPVPIGRALVVQLGPDEFLVTGYFGTVDFAPADAAPGRQREFVRVEEGAYAGGVFIPTRIWNGDETDWGLRFGAAPQVVRVRLGTY
jgi:hypothetical protein